MQAIFLGADYHNLKCNSGGIHKECKEKNIHYTIKNGNYVYFCITCGKIIHKDQVEIEHNKS